MYANIEGTRQQDKPATERGLVARSSGFEAGGADTRFVVSAIPRSGTFLPVFIPLGTLLSLRWLGNAFFILHHSEFIILSAPLSFAERRL